MLGWCLENLIPLHLVSLREWVVIPYEETILYPEKTIELLTKKCNLENKEEMLSLISKPSRSSSSSFFSASPSSTKKVQEMIKYEKREDLITRWRSQVTLEEEKELMSILERFNIDIYKTGSYLPSNTFLS